MYSETQSSMSSSCSDSDGSINGTHEMTGDAALFRWYAVRQPSLRTAPVCQSALGKRHVEISRSCLVFRRVYELQAARDAIPRPLSSYPAAV